MILLYYLTWICNFLPVAIAYNFLPAKEVEPYLYDGENAQHKYEAVITDLPYHVLIVHDNLYCSGTLVRSKIVLSAASCLLKNNMDKTIVKVGANSIIGEGQIIQVIDVKFHEYYGYMNEIDNDIAMLVLNSNVMFGKNVKKAILIEPDTTIRTGVTISVSGYGSDNLEVKYLNRLLKSKMTVMSRDECLRDYKNVMTHSNFCARYQVEHRLSDNGGPAVFMGLLVGIVSYGATNGGEPLVAVLTNVSYFHRWIQLNTKRFLTRYCVSGEDRGYSYSHENYESV